MLKPPGMTSHDVVSWVRRNLKTTKVGHTGTLDPDVSGVLPICVGRATKIAQYLTEKNKGYRGEFILGVETDTQDTSGVVKAIGDASHLTEADIRNAVESKLGVQYQIPPMTSAVKIAGKPLYQLAREGKEVERTSRKVEFFSLEVSKISNLGTRFPSVLIDIECSKGTYIRTLFHDIGQELGVGGTMSFLLRTKSGPYSLAEAQTLEELKSRIELNELDKVILPIETALQGFPIIMVRDSAVSRVKNGNCLYPPGVLHTSKQNFEPEELVCLYSNEDKQLLAMAKVLFDADNRVTFQPVTVF